LDLRKRNRGHDEFLYQTSSPRRVQALNRQRGTITWFDVPAPRIFVVMEKLISVHIYPSMIIISKNSSPSSSLLGTPVAVSMNKTMTENFIFRPFDFSASFFSGVDSFQTLSIEA
jgi:hypothetical protein